MVEGTAGHSRRIVRLVERALRELEASGEAGLAALLRAHPEDEAEVRSRLELLQQSGLAESLPVAPAAPAVPARLGEFEPEARLGEGGMGVVWQAWQPSLSRRVALKVIRPEYLWFQGARERFRREAEAVAKLRHPAIVPIHAVGEEGGVPYLAFELVEGLALDRVVGELLGEDPSRLAAERALGIIAAHDGRGALDGAPPPLFEGRWVDLALRVAIAIGEGLAHAHSRGVLHRDLKPSNAMLTREGEVKLLDFGLASSEGSERVTREGSAPGSLAYMAPELLDRASARADVRSEVYSLGVLLYELLALKAPFEGGSVESVRARILTSTVQPLERRHRGIPWELGAIVACAMERDPARRYVDVTAFVADLRRAIAHEPIEARRASLSRRVWRALQRHPAASTAAVLTAMLVVAVPLTFAFQQARLAAQEAREAQRVREALLVSDRERLRAEQSELELLSGIDRFFVQVGAIGLENIPGTDAARARLMAEAQTLLVQMETRTGARVEVARAIAKARVRQGELLARFGRLDEAEAAARAGLALCERFLVARGDEVELLRHASLAESVIATIARLRDRAELARAATERSLRLLERAAELAPENAVVTEQRAIRLQDLALAHALEGELEESVELFEQSESAYEHLLGLAPTHPLEAFRLVGRTNHAAALANLTRFDEARRIGELGLEDLAAALEESPEDVEVQNSASTLWRVLRGIAQATQDTTLEDRAVAEAAALARSAFERFPERDLFRIEMVETHADWGALRWARGSQEEGLTLLEQAYEASRGLERTQVQRLDALFAMCKSAQFLAIRSNEIGRHARAAEVAAAAQPFALELLQHEPARRGAALRLALERAKGLALAVGPAEAVAALRELADPLALRQADLREGLLPRELLEAEEFRTFRAALPE